MSEPDALHDLKRRLEPLMKGGDSDAPATPQCLAEDAIAALVEGTAGAALREAALPHLASCPRCRRAVAGVARLLTDPAVREALPDRPQAGRRWRRWAAVAVPLAAAAVLLLLVRPEGGTLDRGPLHRGATAPAVPLVTSPRGTVAEARLLRWAAIPEATQYRVTVFDAESRVVYAGEASDTVLALPDSVVLHPGAVYLWIVEARTGWNRWSASAPAEFMIAPDGDR